MPAGHPTGAGGIAATLAALFYPVAVMIVAFGICFWQNHRLLDLLQRPVTRVLVSEFPERLLHQAPLVVVVERGTVGVAAARPG